MCLFVVFGGEVEGTAGCLRAHAWLCFDDPSAGTVDAEILSTKCLQTLSFKK